MQRTNKNIKDNIFVHVYVLLSLIFNKLKGAIAIGICLIIIIALNSNSENLREVRSNLVFFAQSFYSHLTYPVVLGNKFYIGIHDYTEAFLHNKSLINENAELKQEIDKLKIEAHENKKLRKLLHMTDVSLAEEMTVRVIANASNPHLKTFTINAGSDHNIEVGQVLVNQNGLIGKVIDVTKNVSKVLSVTDVNFKIPSIFSQSRVKSIVSGMSLSNEKLIPDLMDLDEEIHDNEPVLTSGEGELIPYGILIGYAQHDENGKLYIKSSVNWDDLEYAQVLKKAD